MDIRLFWRNTRQYRRLCYAVLAAFCVAACHAAGTVDAARQQAESELAGARWKLVELYGRAAEVFDDQPEPHVVFSALEAGAAQEVARAEAAAGRPAGRALRLSGADGCNRLLGIAIFSEKGVRFDKVGTTMMLCPHGEVQARDLVRALEESTALRRHGDRLELLKDDRCVAVFTRTAL